MDKLPAAIADHLEEIRALCVKYHVKRLAVFGSAVKGTFDPATSDVDFVVEFFPHEGPELRNLYFPLLLDLQKLLDRNVDLVERKVVRNPYFLKVLELSEQPLYDAA